MLSHGITDCKRKMPISSDIFLTISIIKYCILYYIYNKDTKYMFKWGR